MLGTCESSRDVVNSYVYYVHQTREIYQVLRYSVEFKAPRRLWNPLSKSILGSFTLNDGPVNI